MEHPGWNVALAAGTAVHTSALGLVCKQEGTEQCGNITTNQEADGCC